MKLLINHQRNKRTHYHRAEPFAAGRDQVTQAPAVPRRRNEKYAGAGKQRFTRALLVRKELHAAIDYSDQAIGRLVDVDTYENHLADKRARTYDPVQFTSNRSSIMTLFHAATKSCANFSLPSSAA